MSETGWFADRADNGTDGHPWAPFLQVEGACHQLGGVWFGTEAECLAFIQDEVFGQGWHPWGRDEPAQDHVCAEKNCDEKATLGQTWRFDSGLRAEISLCERHFDMAEVLTERTVTEEPA